MIDFQQEEQNLETILKENDEWYSNMAFDLETAENNDNHQPKRTHFETNDRNTNSYNG